MKPILDPKSGDSPGQKINYLLLSPDNANIRLGLELALNPEVEIEDLSAMAVVAAFNKDENIRDASMSVLSRLADTKLRQMVAKHLVEAVQAYDASAIFLALEEIAEHKRIDRVNLFRESANRSDFFPVNLAHIYPEFFEAYCKKALGANTMLNLRGMKMPLLPGVISKFPLTFLSLSGCGLHQLPRSLSELKNLELLDLSNNKFSSFPEFLGELKALNELILDRNHCDTLPAFLARLPMLKDFTVDTKEFTDISVLGECRQIVSLRLHQYASGEFPEELLEMSSLRFLESFWKEAPVFSGRLAQLRQLRQLTIDSVRPFAFPDEIGALHDLAMLKIRGCYLGSEAPDLSGMHFLEDFEIVGKMDVWPENWSELRTLKNLEMDRTGLKSLPDSLANLERLENLWLTGCDFGEFPRAILELKRLKVLGLRNCGLEALPEEIAELENLSLIDAGGNGFRELPVSLRDMKQLEGLFIDNSRLSKEQIRELRAALPNTRIVTG